MSSKQFKVRPQTYAFILVLLLGILLVSKEYFASDEPSFNNEKNLVSTSNCPEGSWIDTHLHLETEVAFSELERRMDDNNVGCSLAFIYVDPEDPKDSFEILTEDYNGNLNRIIPYFFITPKTAQDANIDNIKKVRSNTGSFFKGHGEFAFYRDPFKQSSLLDENWKEVFKYSQENEYYIMFHLRGSEQVSQLEEILTLYPKAKLLLHGPELSSELPGLLSKYENLLFTLDTASLLIQKGVSMERSNLMYSPGGEVTFKSEFEKNREKILKSSYEEWFPVIKAAPQRVMWGTDASSDWHFSDDTYEVLVDFSDDFLKMLPEEYREGYMYGNAKRLFLESE
ncbi:hypothetical protein HYV12_01985 [Candidatus Dojkabacteria bacterium]|nr:hypothetical protein [Candidatus Dojkabacteria bacterium]